MAHLKKNPQEGIEPTTSLLVAVFSTIKLQQVLPSNIILIGPGGAF